MTSPQPSFGDFQLEIYLAGLQGVLPSHSPPAPAG